MIVNKSMFPIQTGFRTVTSMNARMGELQMQLGTGQKSSTLAGMGNDLAMSLSVRSRLAGIAAHQANIDTLNLRLSFMNNAVSRLDAIEGEARNSAVPGQYGTGDVNMAMLPQLTRSRLDEVVTLLNAEVAGRYVFGGSVADRAPLPTTEALLEGEGGRAGFRTVMSERRLADLGASGMGRLTVSSTGADVTIAEDGAHPFGFKLSNVTSSGAAISVGPLSGDPAERVLSFDAQPLAEQTVTVGLSLPDGTETQVTLRAVAGAPTAPGQFQIGADEAETAANFAAALGVSLKAEAGTTLAGASAFAAAENFFNGAGEPVLRVDGDPATATALRVGTAQDTVMWYRGESPAVSAEGLGRLTVAAASRTVTLGEAAPVSAAHGFRIEGVASSNGTRLPAAFAPGATSADPGSAGVSFDDADLPQPGDSVTVLLRLPDGKPVSVTLTAVDGTAGPGQFSIGADAESTAAGFGAALEASLYQAARAAEGNPRQSVTAQVAETTKAAYGVQANEAGFARMVRTLAVLSIETYPPADETSRGRFDAMAARQQAQMSEAHNSERGSIELIAMELGIAQAEAGNANKRHVEYKAQLGNLLGDIETVSFEEVAMEIMALQTRLQASFQVTAMVSRLSLVNFL